MFLYISFSWEWEEGGLTDAPSLCVTVLAWSKQLFCCICAPQAPPDETEEEGLKEFEKVDAQLVSLLTSDKTNITNIGVPLYRIKEEGLLGRKTSSLRTKKNREERRLSKKMSFNSFDRPSVGSRSQAYKKCHPLNSLALLERSALHLNNGLRLFSRCRLGSFLVDTLTTHTQKHRVHLWLAGKRPQGSRAEAGRKPHVAASV